MDDVDNNGPAVAAAAAADDGTIGDDCGGGFAQVKAFNYKTCDVKAAIKVTSLD